MPTYTDRVTAIIMATKKADAEAVFYALDPDPLAKSDRPSFSVPCNATGTGSPTHWASFGPFVQETYAVLSATGPSANNDLKTYLDSLPPKYQRDANGQIIRDTDGQPVEAPRVPLGTVQSFKQDVKLGTSGGGLTEFLAFLTANGLKRIEAP